MTTVPPPMDTPMRVGVVGAGTMGAGIAQLGALAGMDTLLHDPIADALDRGVDYVETNLKKGAEKGRWSEDDATAATTTRARLSASATRPTTYYSAATAWSSSATTGSSSTSSPGLSTTT